MEQLDPWILPEEKQQKKGSGNAIAIVLACSVVILGAVCLFQFFKNSEAKSTIEGLTEKVEAQNAQIKEQDSQIVELQKTKRNYDFIAKKMKRTNVGYASKNFNVDKSVIVVDKANKRQKINLTASFGKVNSVSISYEYPKGSGPAFVATLKFDEYEWRNKTTLSVVPYHPGVCIATFKNTVNDQTFKILIVVTESGEPSTTSNNSSKKAESEEQTAIFESIRFSEAVENSKAASLFDRINDGFNRETYSPVERDYSDDNEIINTDYQEEIETPESTAFTRIWYWPFTKELRVEFRKSAACYCYYDVPAEVWEEFKAAGSKGSFFNSEIKGKYEYDRE